VILLTRLPAAMDDIYTNFGVNCSSRLLFRARTHRRTKAQTQLITICLSHTLSTIGMWQLLLRVTVISLISSHLTSFHLNWVHAW